MNKSALQDIYEDYAKDLGLSGLPDDLDYFRCDCEMCENEIKAELRGRATNSLLKNEKQYSPAASVIANHALHLFLGLLIAAAFIFGPDVAIDNAVAFWGLR